MKRLITVTMAFLMLICWMVPVPAEAPNSVVMSIEDYEELINQLQIELDEAKFHFEDELAKNEALVEELHYYKAEIEKMADEFAAEREQLKAEIMELEAEISTLKDKIDTMWNIYNPGGEYPDWSKYTLDQLIAMKDELPKIIEIRILEAYAEGMLEEK